MSLLGATMVSVRSKSGRRWHVHTISVPLSGKRAECTLVPLGDDVSSARSETTGKWQGGVRSICVPYDRLNDERYWRRA